LAHLDLARKEFRCLKRKDLIMTMAKNIPAGAIPFGCHVVAIHQDPGIVKSGMGWRGLGHEPP